eukprot:6923260-Prymnesium_polylepis.1
MRVLHVLARLDRGAMLGVYCSAVHYLFASACKLRLQYGCCVARVGCCQAEGIAPSDTVCPLAGGVDVDASC